jgi:ActR/RegA family two-component response regulator
MKLRGVGVFEIMDAKTAEHVLAEVNDPQNAPFDIAIVELQFSHGSSVENGLYVIELLRLRQPDCHIVCMAASPEIAARHAGEAKAKGANAVLHFSQPNHEQNELGLYLVKMQRERSVPSS